MKHRIAWHTAAPLWDRSLEDTGPAPSRFQSPVLLRFARDTFMEDLEKLLAEKPSELASYVAQHETWRNTAVGWLLEDDFAAAEPVKLYQPAHNRFYLVAASLVCRHPGLPDRTVDVAAQERVFFVLRRLVAKTGQVFDPANRTSYDEYGWFGDRQAGTWQSVAASDSVEEAEERLSLFPLTFQQEGRKRWLQVGLVPVAGREVYEKGAAALAPAASDEDLADDPLGDPRLAVFRERDLRGLDGLAALPNDITDTQAREILVFVLLDLAEFLQEELRTVWNALENRVTSGLSRPDLQLYQTLHTSRVGSESWRNLLVDSENHRQVILRQDFDQLEGRLLVGSGKLTAPQMRTASAALVDADLLLDQVQASLQTRPLDAEQRNGKTPPSEAGADEVVPEALYSIRYVYEQPRCRGFESPVVSRPSRPFRLASFFDPDAPIRPVQIRMPTDTSLKGLHAFPKGLSLLLSSTLRQQMERAQQVGLADLTDGKVGEEPAFNLGVICSFSIPIITICALILLMIIVQLLNIVFWWLPLFRLCFPLRSRS